MRIRREVIATMLTIGVLAALFVFPGAAGAASVSVCNIEGSVDVLPSLNLTPRNGTYEFEDTSIECTGDITATYSVTASGKTTFPGGGETCAAGKSDGAGTVNASKVAGSGVGPTSLTGPVNFVRAGEAVEADGTLDTEDTGTEPNYSWTGAFVFDPDQDATACASTTGGIDSAQLDGKVVVYSV